MSGHKPASALSSSKSRILIVNKQRISDHWLAEYGVPPGDDIDHSSIRDRCIRIHYLPGGEQYPRHSGQYDELLRRLNGVLDHIIGQDEQYVLIVTEYGPSDACVRQVVGSLVEGAFETLREKWYQEHGDTTPVLGATLYFQETTWTSGSQDKLLRAVADEEISGLRFLGGDGPCLAIPYAGGIDIIASDSVQAEALRLEFANWAPFAGEIDEYEVVRAADPVETATLSILVDLGSSIYLNPSNRADAVTICLRVATDTVLKRISELEDLEILNFYGFGDDAGPSQATDQGIEYLLGLKNLRQVVIDADDMSNFPLMTERGHRIIQGLAARGDLEE